METIEQRAAAEQNNNNAFSSFMDAQNGDHLRESDEIETLLAKNFNV